MFGVWLVGLGYDLRLLPILASGLYGETILTESSMPNKCLCSEIIGRTPKSLTSLVKKPIQGANN